MPQILFLGPKDPLDGSRRILLKRAGYKISPVHDINEAIQLKSWEGSALVILGKALPPSERHQVIQKLKAARIGILDLASSPTFKRDRGGLNDYGPESFLELVGRAAMASHGHPEVRGENVAWVDRDRRYVHVSDGFLNLIGYDRDEVLGHLIDDFTYPGTANPKEVFTHYLDNGHMDGRYVLRHKSGEKVPIEFEAGILADGCMYSNMVPVQERKGAKSEAQPRAERKRG